jgi:hypothetical protein
MSVRGGARGSEAGGHRPELERVAWSELPGEDRHQPAPTGAPADLDGSTWLVIQLPRTGLPRQWPAGEPRGTQQFAGPCGVVLPAITFLLIRTRPRWRRNVNLFIQSLIALSTTVTPASLTDASVVQVDQPAQVQFADNLVEKLEDMAPTPLRRKLWGQVWVQESPWKEIQTASIDGREDSGTSAREALAITLAEE